MATPIQSIQINGERFVIVPEAEFRRLRSAGALPPLPAADEEGHIPAIEFIRSTIARDIINERRNLKLTQADLAKLAGVRQETVSRIESGRHKANTRTIEKIDKALKRASARRRKAS